jgi:hypothetical protein
MGPNIPQRGTYRLGAHVTDMGPQIHRSGADRLGDHLTDTVWGHRYLKEEQTDRGAYTDSFISTYCTYLYGV